MVLAGHGHAVDLDAGLDHQVELVDMVKYRANTLVLFITSLNSVHGVTKRLPTKHVRRYVNMLAEFREPLFDLQQYQDDTTPWALTMGGDKS